MRASLHACAHFLPLFHEVTQQCSQGSTLWAVDAVEHFRVTAATILKVVVPLSVSRFKPFLCRDGKGNGRLNFKFFY